MMRAACLTTFLLISFYFFAQTPVNAYAKVTSVTATQLVVSAVDEQYDTFEDGENIIIMQMQGAVVTDTSNSASFGTIAGIGSAGLYEVCTILSHTENLGLPDTITLSAPLQNTYNVNGTLQIISFPKLGGGSSFTTTSDINCKLFDGQTGGVICFEVQGNLFQQHNITADEKGFKGGSVTPSGVGGFCNENIYATNFQNDAAMKGQGIFKPSANLNAGRAPAANGGGGGVVHNGGGAGGGNYTAGGRGGVGYVHLCVTDFAGGLGGRELQYYINPDRIFLGGGGGGGHDNDGFGTSGATGGGIIILKCDSLISSGTCSSVSISANGGNALSDAQDGKGGGGAGGSIVLDVQHVKSSSACPLKITANGGKGGNVTISKQHAGGGGGGQGVIMLLCGGSEESVVFETKNGAGGRNMTAFDQTFADNGAGVDNTAIFLGIVSDSVPAVISSYSAVQDSFSLIVNWTTTYEKNVGSFELQHSAGGSNWNTIATIAGHGSGVFTGTFNYSFQHTTPVEGENFYRLIITDTLGCRFYSPYWSGNYKEPLFSTEVFVYPNPGKDEFVIHGNYNFEEGWFKMYDARGREVPAQFTMITEKKYKIYAPTLEQAVYFVRCFSNKQKKIVRLVVME